MLSNVEQQDMELTHCTMPNVPEINRLETTLEKLIQIPRILNNEEERKSTSFETPERKISVEESDDLIGASSSEANGNALKSALAKSNDKSSLPKNQEKNQKNLRFTPDTVDGEKKKLVRQKVEKKPYPVVMID